MRQAYTKHQEVSIRQLISFLFLLRKNVFCLLKVYSSDSAKRKKMLPSASLESQKLSM